MNAILISAVWGVLMMFTGAFVKSKTVPKYLAMLGGFLLFAGIAVELYTGTPVFDIDPMNMLHTSSFNLTFLAVVSACTLLYFMLSGKEMEKVGTHVAEYFALIFFVMCGVALVSTFNTLLILFIGIEILSIPLYVLTGINKRNLRGNEAALKYFLMGSFSTGLMLIGIAFIYGGNPNGSFYINNILLGSGEMSPMILTGMIFMMVSMAFKVSAAPFHF